jgi:hypothetical protein
MVGVGGICYFERSSRQTAAGAAVGIAILATWLGAVGLAIAIDDPPDGSRSADRREWVAGYVRT